MTYHLRVNDGRCNYNRLRHDQNLATNVLVWMVRFGYRNEDCPARCSTPHEWPHYRPNDDIPSCPDRGEWYEWCDGCDDWVRRHQWTPNTPAYPERFTYEGRSTVYAENDSVNGEWLCSASGHGYFWCEGCDGYRSDDDYGGDGYCDRCYSDEDYSDCGRGYRSGESVTHCPNCGTDNLHVHELTEQYLCDCQAVQAHLAGQPVLFHGERAQGKVLAMLGVAA